jgi:hypothetical protein
LFAELIIRRFFAQIELQDQVFAIDFMYGTFFVFKIAFWEFVQEVAGVLAR